MTDIALVRGVPTSFDRAHVGEPSAALDVDLARRQHDSYVDALRLAGYHIEAIPVDEGHPDCVFIEDSAVVIGPVAVITRSGAPTRRGEVGQVRDALSDRMAIESIEPPGTLDGGDVMQIGGSVFVGRSTRTNQSGIEQLAAITGRLGARLVPVDVHDGLHLKSSVLPVDDATVLVTFDSVDQRALDGLRVLPEATSERLRASVLPLRDRRLLATANTPETNAMLAEAGYDVLPLDISALQAADGGLTCLSILFAEPE